MTDFQLRGKVIISGAIEARTGLRVGGMSGGLKIGGVDLNVITDPLGRPYLPGSSLRGKLRSLLEKETGVRFRNGSHKCDTEQEYAACPACRIWGILTPSNFTVPTPTRLLVRDAFLDEESVTPAMRDNLPLRWTEVKMETAIDRQKGAALRGSLRQVERVPAGARFAPVEMVFNVFDPGEDLPLLKKLFGAMSLLEDDYLGGMGSRGYGRVVFSTLSIYWNTREDYETGRLRETVLNPGRETVREILDDFDQITGPVKK